jgi:hypothetical protein
VVAAKQRGRIFSRPRARRGTIASANEQEEAAMSRKKAFVALAVATALGILGLASAAASDRSDRGRERGFVVPCSLEGVNPVHHPEIFGNPAAAASYGFVRSRGGAWQVVSNCHR